MWKFRTFVSCRAIAWLLVATSAAEAQDQFLLRRAAVSKPFDSTQSRATATDLQENNPTVPSQQAYSQFVEPVSATQLTNSVVGPNSRVVAQPGTVDFGRFQLTNRNSASADRLANNFAAFPDFASGIVVTGENVALKIGGYVKADLISDFDAIDSTDSFDTTTILTDGQDRKNSRFHARQSRLSFDTRWLTNDTVVRAYLEGDFFGGDNQSDFRLRHAYGNFGRFTAGQTWTTFSDPAAVPQTLDFEGAVSGVSRRQGLIRWDQPTLWEGVSCAIALENPRVILELPQSLEGAARTQTPDIITRIRVEGERGTFQGAFLLRELAFQPVGQEVISGSAWGFNFSGTYLLGTKNKAYYHIAWGDGIGSYRGSPDVVATGPNSADILPMFGWMIGFKRQLNKRLTSNCTYSQLTLDNLAGQAADNLNGTNYLALNLIYNPYDRVFCGAEYLHGVREDVGGDRGTADRMQFSFGFYLP